MKLAFVVLLLALSTPVLAATPNDPEVTGVVPGCTCLPMWTLLDGARATKGDWCDPTNEKITLMALVRGRRVPAGSTCDVEAAAEVMRGVRWSDDPDGLLEKNPAAWAKAFTAAEKASVAGHVPGPGSSLLARVHFGDLEALHGMGAVYGENPWVTYKSVIRWSEFLFRVASGDIAGTTKLGKVPVDGFPALFPKRARWTVNQLFRVRAKKDDVRARALGALLHLVEDAFAPGHVRRQNLAGLEAGVLAYFSNEKGASTRHRQDAGWREFWKPDASLWDVAGGREALQRTGDVVWLVNARRSWKIAKSYFDVHVFSIAGIPPPPGYRK